MKLDRGQPPIIMSEIIIPGENGCSGGNIPISHFLLSLTHSALSEFTGFIVFNDNLKKYRFLTYLMTTGKREMLAQCASKNISFCLHLLCYSYLALLAAYGRASLPSIPQD